MTVFGLRHAIRELPDDMPVILARNAEGNAYSPLAIADADGNHYVADTTWSGHLDPGDDKAVACVVLWPVN